MSERGIHQALGDLVKLGQDAITMSNAPTGTFEERHDRIVAELIAICTAKPSRKPFVDCAKILSIALRKLMLARRSGDADRTVTFESAVGFMLPYVRRESFEALVWEREQETP